jgi:hypothetical protein
VNLTDLKPYIDAPKHSEVPVPGLSDAIRGISVAFETPQYTGVISWTRIWPNGHDGPIFDCGTDGVYRFDIRSIYTAVITLITKPGYTFSGLAPNAFTYGDDYGSVTLPPPPIDQGAITSPAGTTTGRIEVTIVFPETGSLQFGV